MKTLVTATLLLLVLATSSAFAGTLTVGSNDSGNCYPFMCNDSGTSSGTAMDYQEVYASSAFPGAVSISSLTYNWWSNLGPSNILGGTYTFSWGYSGVGLILTSNLPGNYNGASSALGSFSIPAGGQNYGSSFTFTPASAFVYNPALGDLIIEIVSSNQDLIANGQGNGYNQADYTSGTIYRAYCFGSGGCSTPPGGALVTTFNESPAVPEPGTLVMFGSGLIGLAGIARRKFNL